VELDPHAGSSPPAPQVQVHRVDQGAGAEALQERFQRGEGARPAQAREQAGKPPPGQAGHRPQGGVALGARRAQRQMEELGGGRQGLEERRHAHTVEGRRTSGQQLQRVCRGALEPPPVDPSADQAALRIQGQDREGSRGTGGTGRSVELEPGRGAPAGARVGGLAPGPEDRERPLPAGIGRNARGRVRQCLGQPPPGLRRSAEAHLEVHLLRPRLESALQGPRARDRGQGIGDRPQPGPGRRGEQGLRGEALGQGAELRQSARERDPGRSARPVLRASDAYSFTMICTSSVLHSGSPALRARTVHLPVSPSVTRIVTRW